ncbi:unnamed protein product, partial [Mesorhabditis belari]|uniref:t-SNARE coiled-coil homology domain-containing protein n=1 Tax=Mesorhabditis belari TaxID=2138241 RepID=A0AAF3EAB6_9BILA
MSNPFEDYKTVKSYTAGSGAIEDDVDYYEKEIEKYMQESLDSTERSRRNLDQSEQVGAKTAQDLLEQREKLERTERNLDDIHRNTQQTQRNLNSLKSVFGGFFKNKFSRKPAEPPAESEIPQSKSASHLSDTVTQVGSSSGSGSSKNVQQMQGGSTLSESSRNTIKNTRWEAMNNQIDENLDDMSQKLSSLRNLGAALGKEVDDQNQMLDRIQVKADRNDAIVRNQDHQMKKLLGYKGVDKPQDSSAFGGKK